jgi:ubiquinone/menaquinone biosynthesis C-methylase UbiE
VDARLQRRVQRYGWDLAAGDYELLWQKQLAPAQEALLAAAALAPEEEVLDVACGTGLVSLAAAAAVGRRGRVLGVDLSAQMVAVAAHRAGQQGQHWASFARMDAEALALPAAGFDAVLCALGLMYVPDPLKGLREMRRVLRPGGRVSLAVWGERSRCGWASVFEIVDAEVQSEVCPLFFQLGQAQRLVQLCGAAGLCDIEEWRIPARLEYADGREACDAAFVGGPVALAWSRFDATARARCRERYLASIEPWRCGTRYALPGEFVVVRALAPEGAETPGSAREPTPCGGFG